MASHSVQPLTVWLVEDDRQYCDTMATLLNRFSMVRCPRAFESTEALLEEGLPSCAPTSSAPASDAEASDAEASDAGSEAERDDETSSCPDVLLLDIHLPGQTGIEALPAIRSASPATAVVMLTVAEDSTMIFEAFRSGASGYLLKDAPLEDILEAVRQAAAGGTLMPPAVAEHVLSHFRGSHQKSAEYGLTPREREVLQLMIDGLSQRRIAKHLHVSPHTVNTHVQHLYQKLHVNSGIEAVVKAVREGLV